MTFPAGSRRAATTAGGSAPSALRAAGSAAVAALVALLGWMALVAHESGSGGAGLLGAVLPAGGAAEAGRLDGETASGGADPGVTAGVAGDSAISLGQPTIPLGHADAVLAAALEDEPPVVAHLVEAAEEHGVGPRLVLAVAWQESRLKPGARSHAGAVGVMQVKPATVQRVGDELGESLVPFDPADNATAGVVYLSWLLDELDDTRQALIAYNQGKRALDVDGPYPSARAYADAVLETRRHLEEADWEP